MEHLGASIEVFGGVTVITHTECRCTYGFIRVSFESFVIRVSVCPVRVSRQPAPGSPRCFLRYF